LLVESDAPGCDSLVREVRLVSNLDRVEIIDTVDKKAVRTVEGMHILTLALLAANMQLAGASPHAPSWTFQTRYARIAIDGKGFITAIVSLKSRKEYGPVGQPSPLISLHEYGQPNDKLLFPTFAVIDKSKQEFSLKYRWQSRNQSVRSVP
jgi:hypothetical protein